MTDLRAQFILTFEDKVTAGLRKLQEQLRGLRNAGGALGGGALKQATEHATRFGRALHTIGAAARAAAGHLGGMLRGAERLGKRVGAIGALVGFGALKETTQTYADYDAVLRQILIAEGRDRPGRDAPMLARLGARFNRLALASGKSSGSIAEAYEWMVKTHPGANEKMVRAIVNSMIPALVKGATAYDLHMSQVSNIPFALYNGLHLRGSQMEEGLAILHRATMQAHFTMSAFDQELPGLAAQFGNFKFGGLHGLRSLAAMLETIVKVVPARSPQEAGSDLVDLLRYVTGPAGQARLGLTSRGFGGKSPQLAMYRNTIAMLRRAGVTHGLNAPVFLASAAKEGYDPVTATAMWLHSVLSQVPKTMNPKARAVLQGEVVNALISNQQAATAMLALLQNWKEHARILATLQKVGPAQFNRDFIAMQRAPITQMRIMAEGFRQVGYVLGHGFMPVLRAVNYGLLDLVHFLTWANTRFPATTRWVLGLAGAGIALVAALGALGFIAPAVAGGFVLLLDVLAALAGAAAAVAGPFAGVAIVIGAAAYDIYAHWARFGPMFAQGLRGLEEIARGLAGVLTGIANFNWHSFKVGIADIGHGFATAWVSELHIVLGLLGDLLHFLGLGTKAVQHLTNIAEHPLAAVEHALSPAKGHAPASVRWSTGGMAADPSGMGALMPVVTVKVGVDPHHGKIAITHASAPSIVRVQPLDMGDMLAFSP